MKAWQFMQSLLEENEDEKIVSSLEKSFLTVLTSACSTVFRETLTFGHCSSTENYSEGNKLVSEHMKLHI